MVKKQILIHPFLFALYPVLFLFSYNIGEVSFLQTIVPMVAVLILTLILLSISILITRNIRKAGIVVSAFLLLFFSYRMFFEFLTVEEAGIYPMRDHNLLVLALSLIFIYVLYVVVRTKKNLYAFTSILNVVALSMILGSLFNIGLYQFRPQISRTQGREEIYKLTKNSEKANVFPHIYYIILDGYARQDVMKEIYEYDNTALIDYLVEKGFYVAKKSSANYSFTLLSLASSMNLMYLHDLLEVAEERATDCRPLNYLIAHNSVANMLKQYGYKFITFSSPYSWTNITNSDSVVGPNSIWDEFANELLNTTPVSHILSAHPFFNVLLKRHPYYVYKAKTLYMFEHLADISETKTPCFIFAHIIAPHPPFIFGQEREERALINGFEMRDGAYLMRHEDYLLRYKKEAAFVSERIKEVVGAILRKSARPVIILLQADHGPGSMLDPSDPERTNLKERFSIFNAYYFPDSNYDNLYDSITPVNTFRVVFNRYFGGDFEILEDRCYFAPRPFFYKHIDVTDKIRPETTSPTKDQPNKTTPEPVK